jgi:type IV pilus assembly protein PilC
LPTFEYSGKTRTGKPIKGTLEAEDRNDVFRQLRSRGILATNVRKKAKNISLSFGGGIKNDEITNFARQFASMISAGLPLIQCLNIISQQTTNPQFKEVLVSITQSVESGNSLAESMRRHPKVFSELFVNMVAAGEIGGILDTILLRLATFLEKSMVLQRKIKGAMMYPIVISIVMVVAVTALLIFVIPIFAKMFESSGSALPGPTQLVVNMSNFLKNPTRLLPLIGIITSIGIVFKKYQSTPAGRLNVDSIILKMPVFGDLARKSAIALFSRTLGTLLSSGVTILEALDITAKTATNMVVRNALKSMITAISSGKTITEPMKTTGVFPPMVIQMVAVGEESGGLDNMLNKIADFYDEEVNAAVDTLTSLMEPVIIVLLAIVMGGTLVAMYMPMFDMIGTVGG